MSLSFCRVRLAGRLAQLPELKQTVSGTSVCHFSVAVNKPAKDGEEQKADFIDVIAWRGTAEFLCRNFKKGQAIYIEGSLGTRIWVDKQGYKRKAVEVTANEILFADSRSNAEATPDFVPAFSKQEEPSFTDHDTDSDLPF